MLDSLDTQIDTSMFKDLTAVTTFTYNKSGSSIDQIYPEVTISKSVALQTDTSLLTFFLAANYVTNELFFRLMDSEGVYIIEFRKLVEYPTNLIANLPTLHNYYLYFFANALYFGKLDELE